MAKSKRKSRLMKYLSMTIKAINGDCRELRIYINGGDES